MWTFRGLAAFWALLAIPGIILWPQSVLFVILMSVYANAASSWASAEASDDRQVIELLAGIEAKLDDLLRRETGGQ